MSIVRNLTVTVTYQVSLGNFILPSNIRAQLEDACDRDEEINPCGVDYLEAADWLAANIREGDCIYWDAKIDNIE